MHQHKCPEWDYLEISPGDPEMQACICDPISRAQAELASAPCHRHCTVCEGADHHWMPDCDDDNGMPVMKCKHCEARRIFKEEDYE